MTAPSRFRRVRFARLTRFPKLYLRAMRPEVPDFVLDAMAALVAEVRAERSLP